MVYRHVRPKPTLALPGSVQWQIARVSNLLACAKCHQLITRGEMILRASRGPVKAWVHEDCVPGRGLG